MTSFKGKSSQQNGSGRKHMMGERKMAQYNLSVGETGVGEMGGGETEQIIGETVVGETGEGEMGVIHLPSTRRILGIATAKRETSNPSLGQITCSSSIIDAARGSPSATRAIIVISTILAVYGPHDALKNT